MKAPNGTASQFISRNGETYALEVYQPSPGEPVYAQIARLASFLLDAKLIWRQPFDTYEQAEDYADSIAQDEFRALIDLFDQTVPSKGVPTP